MVRAGEGVARFVFLLATRTDKPSKYREIISHTLDKVHNYMNGYVCHRDSVNTYPYRTTRSRQTLEIDI